MRPCHDKARCGPTSHFKQLHIRHAIEHRPTPRTVTSRRLAAARRALQRERDRYALFADQVLQEQESPADRIARFDAELLRQIQLRRDLTARHWRWGRRMLWSLPEGIRDDILVKWNRSTIPPTAAYFADFVRRELRKRGLLLN